MKVTVELPRVAGCSAESCAFNHGSKCHASAITIGDEESPGCDTFFNHTAHCRETNRMAVVGACKVVSCHHNHDFQCDAEEILVGYAKDNVLCLTFSKKQI